MEDITYTKNTRTRQTTMEKINSIWKSKTGRDLTSEETWKMLDFIRMILENANKNINKESEKA